MSTSTQLHFLQNHKPLLKDGEYKITVTQTLILLFRTVDFTHADRLLDKLKSKSDPLSQYLEKQFQQSIKDLNALIEELNHLLKRGSSLYDEDAFSDVTLRIETTDYLNKQNPETTDLVYLNRLLLEDAYPDEIAKTTTKLNASLNKTFQVAGERFQLKPQDIHSVFPPDHNLGEHSNVLPHIILNRSTLPWERKASDDENTPWLALLVFDQEEVAPISTSPQERYNLRLMSVATTDELVDEGQSLLIVALVGKALHIRIFDVSGEQVVDKAQSELIAGKALTQLRRRLAPFPDESNLSQMDRQEIIKYATSSAGYTPQEDPTTLAANAHKVTTKIVSLEELKAGSHSSPFFPALTLEKGQKTSDKAKVIDVPKKLRNQPDQILLDQIMPTAAALQFLTHVRQTEDDKGSVERAVIIANRLPKSGSRSVAHLVSVEDRFTETGEFDFGDANDQDKIRLVSLKSWEFTCMERYRITDEAIAHLEHSSAPLIDTSSTIPLLGQIRKLTRAEFFSKQGFLDALQDQTNNNHLIPDDLTQKDETGKTNQEKILKAFGFGDFASILKKLDRTQSTLRLPETKKDTTADQFLKMGYTPTPHYFRLGDKSISWYHGPLSPLKNPPFDLNLPLPARAADHVLQYYENIAMLDASYAAAWEVGRLLALQDKSFSTNLYHWKRHHTHQLKKESQQSRNKGSHLPGANRVNLNAYRLPDDLTNWFYDLHLLKGLPFNYLVPDEAMLPTESIRFFTLDKLWTACLIDGAFSIGRVITHDHRKDENLFHAILKKSWDKTINVNLMEQNSESLETTLSGLTPISGCLIRSEVVAGWPGLLIEASARPMTNNGKSTDLIKPIRMETLSQNVLLLLFEGEIQTLDIHLKPETLHFGFSVDPHDPNHYHKKLRKENGEEHNKAADLEKYAINFTVDPKKRVIKITDNAVPSEAKEGLVKLIQKKYDSEPDKTQIVWGQIERGEATSAEFALQMIEGVEKVRFYRHPSKK